MFAWVWKYKKKKMIKMKIETEIREMLSFGYHKMETFRR